MDNISAWNRDTIRGCGAYISRLNGGAETPETISLDDARELIKRASWGLIKGTTSIPIAIEKRVFKTK